MSGLKYIFTGSRFWFLNAFVNLIFAVITVLTGGNTMLPFIVMWISFAAFEILKQLEIREEPNAI